MAQVHRANHAVSKVKATNSNRMAKRNKYSSMARLVHKTWAAQASMASTLTAWPVPQAWLKATSNSSKNMEKNTTRRTDNKWMKMVIQSVRRRK